MYKVICQRIPKLVNSRNLLSTDSVTMNSVKIENVEARSGEKRTGYLSVGETAVASVQLPVAVINGSKPGPTLCISGGVHGFEYSSIIAVMRIIRETDPATLKGALVAVPVVNMFGFEARGPQGGSSTPFQCPIDAININRVMPGNPDGSMAYQIAAAFMGKVVSKADFLIDCHGGDLNEELVPFVVTAPGNEGPHKVAKEMLAPSFATEYVIEEAVAGGTHGSALALGKPAVIVEAGGYGRVIEEAVDLISDGIRNTMKRLEMLEGTPTTTKQIVRRGWWSVYVKRGGVCQSVPVGARVKKGQQVAEVQNLFGEPIETVESPVDGKVIFRRTPIAISTNDRVLGIAPEEDLPPPKTRPYP